VRASTRTAGLIGRTVRNATDRATDHRSHDTDGEY
jgi:hypothetical protein